MGWMTVAGGDGDQLAALWRRGDELSADRCAVRNAIANNVLDGHHPTADDIARLIAYAAGEMSMADYLTHVQNTARRQRSKRT